MLIILVSLVFVPGKELCVLLVCAEDLVPPGEGRGVITDEVIMMEIMEPGT